MPIRTQVDPVDALSQSGGFAAATRVPGEWIDVAEWDLAAFMLEVSLGSATSVTFDVEARRRGGETLQVVNADGSDLEVTFSADGDYLWPALQDGVTTIRAHQVRIGATFTGTPSTASTIVARAVKVQ